MPVDPEPLMTEVGLRMTHEQAETRLRDIHEEMERLSKRDTLDEADEARWAELRNEAERTAAYRADMERKADLAKLRSAAYGDGTTTQRVRIDEGYAATVAEHNSYDVDPAADYRSAEDLKRRDPWDNRNLRTFGRAPEDMGSELRARALDAIAKMPGASDSIRSAGTSILERFGDTDGRFARLTLALSSPAYMRGFVKNMSARAGEVTPAESRAIEEARSANRAMSLTDTAGGFLVPFQLDPTIILTGNGSYNEIRQIARQVVATGDVWNGVSAGAVQWSFDAEAAEVSDDAPTFAQPTITIRTARGFVPISLEAFGDAANVTAEIGRLLAEGKDDREAEVFVTGTVAGNQPVGIVTALTGVAASTITSAAADTFALGDVHRVRGALPARYRARASWLANDGFYSLTRQADTSDSMWRDLAGDRPALLLGKPVYEAEAMDGTVTATQDNLVAIFGDFGNYVIADRVGMTVEFIPHLFATATNLPSGQRGWFAHYRVGANSVNNAAFRVYNVT